MRHRSLSVALLVVGGLASASASAQQFVTQSYRGVVTSVDGAQPDAVAVGDPITVSYTVDAAATDRDPDPRAGIFLAGLVGLTAQLPASDLAVTSGVGQVQTFDNTDNPDDQVSIYTSTIDSAGALQGLPVLALELGFIGDTDMLASDAMPVHRLEGENTLRIATSRGWTNARFELTAEPTVPELVEDGILRLQAAMAAGSLAKGPGNALVGKLQRLRQAFLAGQGKQACAAATSFAVQLRGLARGRLVDPSLASEMHALARELALALDGC